MDSQFLREDTRYPTATEEIIDYTINDVGYYSSLKHQLGDDRKVLSDILGRSELSKEKRGDSYDVIPDLLRRIQSQKSTKKQIPSSTEDKSTRTIVQSMTFDEKLSDAIGKPLGQGYRVDQLRRLDCEMGTEPVSGYEASVIGEMIHKRRSEDLKPIEQSSEPADCTAYLDWIRKNVASRCIEGPLN